MFLILFILVLPLRIPTEKMFQNFVIDPDKNSPCYKS